MAGDTQRQIKDGKYCWQSKPALWRIRESFDESTFLDQSIAVYTILTELASDAQSDTFTATRRKIAERSGVSVRRVSEIIMRLRELKLVDWKQNFLAGTKELAPSTYTLMSCQASTTPSTPCTRLCTDVFSEICTVEEESNKESPKESNKRTASFMKPSIEEISRYALEIGLPILEAEKFRDHYQSNGWMAGRVKMTDWRASIRNWKRNYESRNTNGGKPNSRNTGLVNNSTEQGNAIENHVASMQ